MAHSFDGKIVLITGAAGGIGSVLVKLLIEENVKHVAMLDVAEDAGIALQNEINEKHGENKATFIKCDVTDKEKLCEAFTEVKEDIGYIDVVINNAGILDDSPENYLTEINLNLSSLITSSLNAWHMMHKDKGGKGGTIINFSSVTALCFTVNVPIYSATKVAVLKFSACLGNHGHYSRSGVRVLAMCFGLTDTPLLKNTQNLFDESALEPIMEDFKNFKLQSPESAAKAVVDAYKQGASGSIWISTSDKPAIDVTKTYRDGVELFSEYVYN